MSSHNLITLWLHHLNLLHHHGKKTNAKFGQPHLFLKQQNLLDQATANGGVKGASRWHGWSCHFMHCVKMEAHQMTFTPKKECTWLLKFVMMPKWRKSPGRKRKRELNWQQKQRKKFNNKEDCNKKGDKKKQKEKNSKWAKDVIWWDMSFWEQVLLAAAFVSKETLTKFGYQQNQFVCPSCSATVHLILMSTNDYPFNNSICPVTDHLIVCSNGGQMSISSSGQQIVILSRSTARVRWKQECTKISWMPKWIVIGWRCKQWDQNQISSTKSVSWLQHHPWKLQSDCCGVMTMSWRRRNHKLVEKGGLKISLGGHWHRHQTAKWMNLLQSLTLFLCCVLSQFSFKWLACDGFDLPHFWDHQMHNWLNNSQRLDSSDHQKKFSTLIDCMHDYEFMNSKQNEDARSGGVGSVRLLLLLLMSLETRAISAKPQLPFPWVNWSCCCSLPMILWD